MKPEQVSHRAAPLSDEEIDQLLPNIRKIKLLLFCRLILKHASVLPAALRADSVSAFLGDQTVPAAEIRDICVQMEQPDLQDLRDACADLHRQDETVEDDKEVQQPEEQSLEKKPKHPLATTKKHGAKIPDRFELKREKSMPDPGRETQKYMDSEGVDFGVIDDDSQHDIKKIRVKVCGKQIFYYPSDKAMARDGWLEFSVIAKDSSLMDAISLCRSWEEFFQVNILMTFQYFPNGSWLDWVQSRANMQLLQLGFIVYFKSEQAEKMTYHRQVGTRAQGRSHSALELRTFMCAHIKRNDPASRRLIQYLRMNTAQLRVLVRDAKTGKIVCSPPEEELWLMRSKMGLGRLGRSQWQTVKEVGPEFFEEMDRYRPWHFGFRDHYDIYVWDREPGNHGNGLQEILQNAILKSQRFRHGADMYRIAEPILRTIHHDSSTHRVRDVRSGESSMWDDMNSNKTQYMYGDSQTMDLKEQAPPADMVYSKSDELEEAELFPEGQVVEDVDGAIPLNNFMHDKWNIDRFIHGYAYEEDSDIEEELKDLDLSEEEDAAAAEEEESSSPDGADLAEDDMDDTEDGPLDEDDSELVDEVDDDADMTDDQFFASQGLGERQSKGLMTLLDRMAGRPSQSNDPDDLAREFWVFIDAQKAALFKHAWHNCDMEPGARQRFEQTQKALRRFRRTLFDHDNTASLLRRRAYTMGMLKQLGNMPDWTRVTSRDIQLAYASASVFFLDSIQRGLSFDDSTGVTQQEERSKNIPVVRSHFSGGRRPKAFWKERESRLQKTRLPNGDSTWDDDIWTEDDRCTIRPILARFYKQGVIEPAYRDGCCGYAMAGQEPNKPKDLYFDFGANMGDGPQFAAQVRNPQELSHIHVEAAAFAATRPQARFSVLRIWSAPHFWPLMLGPDNRTSTPFLDSSGRMIEWKFIPKDMPWSEWPVHYNVSQRFAPYLAYFRGGSAEAEGGFPGKARRGEVDHVHVRCDKVLVMGEDEEECLKYTTAAIYCIQTKPWRLEVDMLKSFGNVTLDFLKGLDDYWTA